MQNLETLEPMSTSAFRVPGFSPAATGIIELALGYVGGKSLRMRTTISIVRGRKAAQRV